LLGLLLFAFEIGSLVSRAGGPLVFEQAGLGPLRVDRAFVQALASHEVRQVQSVQAFQLRVERGSKGLLISGRLTVDPTANLVEVTQAVGDRIRAAVGRSLGQPVEAVLLQCLPSVTRRPATGDTGVTFAQGQKGAASMFVQPTTIMERIGPVLTGVAGVLFVILGILIIVFPPLLAWVIGIGLMLLGVATLVALGTRPWPGSTTVAAGTVVPGPVEPSEPMYPGSAGPPGAGS
jgi:hypothetical protein